MQMWCCGTPEEQFHPDKGQPSVQGAAPRGEDPNIWQMPDITHTMHCRCVQRNGAAHQSVDGHGHSTRGFNTPAGSLSLHTAVITGVEPQISMVQEGQSLVGCPLQGSHLCLPLCSLRHEADRPHFMHCDGRATSSRSFAKRIAQFSHGLSQMLALPEGAVLMLASLNTDLMLEALLAICDAGCIANPVNHRWSAQELCAAMHLTQPRVILSDAHCLGLVQQALALLSSQQMMQPPFLIHLGLLGATSHAQTGGTNTLSCSEDLIAQVGLTMGCPDLQLKQPASGAALICFTSGTTGLPKGVMLSHTAFQTQSLAKLAVVGYHETDTYMHVAPLFHIGGLSSAVACIMAGASHVLLPKYTAQHALSAIHNHHVTTFIAVPAIMQDLVSHASDHSNHQVTPMTSVTCILMGGGVTSPALQESISQWFPAAHVFSAYGMTEACSSITFQTLLLPCHSHLHTAHDLQPQSHASQYGEGHQQHAEELQGVRQDVYAGAVCVGRPAPGVALRVVPLGGPNQEQSASSSCTTGQGGVSRGWAGTHEVGEVWTRGPHTMTCYWRNEQETSKALVEGGWLCTGDLGFLDSSGNLWLKGRAKDMIKTGGENVYAAEVEAALCSHPDVQSAVVVGMPDARWGEAVAALITLQPGTRWTGPAVSPSTWNEAPQPHTAAQQQQQQRDRDAVAPQQTSSGNALTPSGLQDHCRHTASLSPYKLPRFIAAVVVSAPEHGQGSAQQQAAQLLPVNASGKVMKDRVKVVLVQVRDSTASAGNLPSIRSKL